MRGKYDSKIPVPGERFSYVVIHPKNTFDLHGRKLTPTKGEKMEFADVTKELEKKLDLYHYFEKLLLDSVLDLLCMIRSTSQHPQVESCELKTQTRNISRSMI